MRARTAALSAAATFALALAGCGASGSDATGTNPGDGKQIFLDSGCASCHALAAADSTGGSGPDLNKLPFTAEQVATQVENGGGGMPAYADKLDAEQIKAVSQFVAENGPSAGK